MVGGCPSPSFSPHGSTDGRDDGFPGTSVGLEWSTGYQSVGMDTWCLDNGHHQTKDAFLWGGHSNSFRRGFHRNFMPLRQRETFLAMPKPMLCTGEVRVRAKSCTNYSLGFRAPSGFLMKMG